MTNALLYHVRVNALSRTKVKITLVPTWLGRWLRRPTRSGFVFRARDQNDNGLHWWWQATDRWVGTHVERYIEAAPVLTIDDMTVEQLLLDVPDNERKG